MKSVDFNSEDQKEKYCSSLIDDDALLAGLGYEKKLHRGLGAVSNFAFGFTEVAVLASITSLYGYGLLTGGELTSMIEMTSSN